MSDITTSNLGFSRVQNTIYDSKVVAGLVNAGSLPSDKFRVITGTITYATGTSASGTILPVIDNKSGEQVQLGPNTQILQATITSKANSAPSGYSSSAAYTVGLAATGGGVVATGGEIVSATTFASTIALAGGPVGKLMTTVPQMFPSTGTYLVSALSAATGAVAGSATVTLTVV